MKRFIFGFILTTLFSLMLYLSISFLNTPIYKIRFNTNGGSKIPSILVKENSTLSSLPVTTKENYEFLGWYLDNDLFDLKTKITKDYLLEAKWSLKSLPNLVNIFFISSSELTLIVVSLKSEYVG